MNAAVCRFEPRRLTGSGMDQDRGQEKSRMPESDIRERHEAATETRTTTTRSEAKTQALPNPRMLPFRSLPRSRATCQPMSSPTRALPRLPTGTLNDATSFLNIPHVVGELG